MHPPAGGEEVAELAGSTLCPSESQPSADTSTGSGCVPWLTCGSCCGSPSSSRFRADTAAAIVLASEYCPASSTTSRSSEPRRNPARVAEVPGRSADDVAAGLPA